MKACTKCKENKTFDRFPVTDFGKPGSQCKDCMSKNSLKSYYKRKGIDTNEGLQTESAVLPMKNETKCKDFFFYLYP